MLDLNDVSKWWQEIQSAEEQRQKHLKGIENLVDQTTGPRYKGKTADGGIHLENRYQERQRQILPSLILDNPRWKVTSRISAGMLPMEGMGVSRADLSKHCLDRWTRETCLDEILTDAANSGIYSYGAVYIDCVEYDGPVPKDVAKIGLEKGEVPYTPRVQVLEDNQVIWDAAARRWRDTRWRGHRYVRSKADLLERAKDHPDEGWDAEAIRAVPVNGHGMAEMRPDAGATIPERGDILVYEVFVAEGRVEGFKKDEGFHGAILTLACDVSQGTGGTPKFIRKPRAYYGHKRGPYRMWGEYPVKGNPFPLSQIVACAEQVDNLNALKRAYSEASKNVKRGYAVTGDKVSVARAVRSFRENNVFTYEGLEKPIRDIVQQLDVGGPPDSLERLLTYEDATANRALGMNDISRGNLGGADSATEAALADTATNRALSFIRKRWQRFVNSVGEGVLWYFAEDERVRYPVDPSWLEETAPMAYQEMLAANGGQPPGELWYGPDPDEVPFEAYELEVEAYSMERMDEGLYQRRLMEFFGLLPAYVQMATMAPNALDWGALLESMAQAMNLPALAVKLKPEGLQEAFMAQQAGQGSGGPGQPPGAASGPPGGLGGGMMPGAAFGAMMAGGVR